MEEDFGMLGDRRRNDRCLDVGHSFVLSAELSMNDRFRGFDTIGEDHIITTS